MPFIAAFCHASKGYEDGSAVHYPRVSENPSPQGEAFEWFVENENDTREEIGRKLALPSLASKPLAPLPIHPKSPKRRRNNNWR